MKVVKIFAQSREHVWLQSRVAWTPEWRARARDWVAENMGSADARWGLSFDK